MQHVLLLLSVLFLAGCQGAARKDTPACVVMPWTFDPENLLSKTPEKQQILKGGLSGARILKVTHLNRSYVLREMGQRAMNDRLREINAHITASEQGYGPKVYAHDIQKGLVLMEILETRPLSHPMRFKELAMAVKKMHGGPAFCTHISLLNQTKALLQSTPLHLSKKQRHIFEMILNQTPPLQDVMPVPTHRDLNPNNIFITKDGAKFIDYENAGLDDPYMDLAAITLFEQATQGERKTFLHLYLGRPPSPKEEAHLAWARRLMCLFEGLTLHKIAHTTSMLEETSRTLDLVTALSYTYSGSLNLSHPEDLRRLADAFLREGTSTHNPTVRLDSYS